MPKMKRAQLLDLLKHKENRTFKELSKISGYHEKYLIRIYPFVIEDKITSQPNYKNRIAHNKMDASIIHQLQTLYKNKNYKNKKAFYLDLKKNNLDTPSYSKLCVILKNITKYKKMCVFAKYIINEQITYVAFDYETLEILFVMRNIKNNKTAFHMLFKNVIMNYGVPNYISCDSLFSKLKKYCDDDLTNFHIKKVECSYDVKKAIRKVRKKLISHNQVLCKKVFYKKSEYNLTLFYPKTIIQVNKNLTFQFQNVRYCIKNKKMREGKAIAYYTENYQVEVIEQNNMISEVEILKKVISKKGLTKYGK